MPRRRGAAAVRWSRPGTGVLRRRSGDVTLAAARISCAGRSPSSGVDLQRHGHARLRPVHRQEAYSTRAHLLAPLAPRAGDEAYRSFDTQQPGKGVFSSIRLIRGQSPNCFTYVKTNSGSDPNYPALTPNYLRHAETPASAKRPRLRRQHMISPMFTGTRVEREDGRTCVTMTRFPRFGGSLTSRRLCTCFWRFPCGRTGRKRG